MDEIEKTIQFSQSRMQSLSILLLKEKPDTISYIFEAYELLRSLSLVVKLLNYKQIKPSKKTEWSIDAVRSILTNPIYSEYSFFFDPATIKACERCQRILNEQKAGNAQTHLRNYCHVFSGLLYCLVCGRSMNARSGKRKELGRSPANYSCLGRRNHTCNSCYISESGLGVFIYNLILNLYRISKHTKDFLSVHQIEELLLAHNNFPSIHQIAPDDLKMLLEQASTGKFSLFSEFSFHPRISLDMIQMQKECGINDFVYLLSPELGIQKLNDSFYHEKRLNYWGLMDEVNPLILKEFLQHFVTRIYVDHGTVSSITFKNDFTLHFIISNPFKNFTELFDIQ